MLQLRGAVMNTIFVNVERCIGCRQCEFACAVEHSKSHDAARAVAESPPPRARIHVEAGPFLNSALPNRCHHCDPAPCQMACPTGAIFGDAAHGLVLVAADKCIACAMCAMVCPFDVVTFHVQQDGLPARVVATKCDGCVDRLRRGLDPACSEACKTGAIVFGELNELVRATHVATPDNVLAWHAWGEATTQVVQGASNGHSSSR